MKIYKGSIFNILFLIFIIPIFAFFIISSMIDVFNCTSLKLKIDGYIPIEATYVRSEPENVKVADTNTSYFFTYDVNEITYTSYIKRDKCGAKNVGDKCTIYYNPSNPSEIAHPSDIAGTIFMFVFYGIFLILILITTISLIRGLVKKKKYSY